MAKGKETVMAKAKEKPAPSGENGGNAGTAGGSGGGGRAQG